MSEEISVTGKHGENGSNVNPRILSSKSCSSVNEGIFKQIESGNINREFIFENFKGLGETVEHHGFNPNEKRNLTYQQYFTPYPVIEFVTKALNLDSAENVIVFDNSAGMGRMFRYLHPSTRIIGIEKEEQAFKVCKALFPDAQIIQDDLINHILFKTVDVSLINPPFSMHLEKRDSGLYICSIPERMRKRKKHSWKRCNQRIYTKLRRLES